MKKQNFTGIFFLLVLLISLLNTIKIFAQEGNPDLSFNTADPGYDNPLGGANNTVWASAIQADGKIIIGGQFTAFNAIPKNYLARLNADGTIDASFNTGGDGPNDMIRTIVIQPDGKILVGGDFFKYNGEDDTALIRLKQNGSKDIGFVHPRLNGVNALCIQPDGKILVGTGFFTSPIVRLNTDGSLDDTFSAHISGPSPIIGAQILSISLDANGHIIVGGIFGRILGVLVTNIARLNPDGSRDESFNPIGIDDPGSVGTDSYVYATAIQSDGKILIGGFFNSYQTLTTVTHANHIIRLNNDGSVDASFNAVGIGANAEVNAIILTQQDGKIFIGGSFNSYNGSAVNRLARLNPDGSLDSRFNINDNVPGMENSTIRSLTAQPDGRKFLAGGSFISYGNAGKNRITRVYNCKTSTSSTNVAVCTGSLPYTWNGDSYAAAGTYTKILTNVEGCDSIAALVLSVPLGSISGPSRACPYTLSAGGTAVYTIAAPASSVFLWSVSNPTTMLVIGGLNNSILKIKFTDVFATGVVYCRVSNATCGFVLRPSFAVSRAIPPAPGIITAGTGNVCPFLGTTHSARYSIRKVAAATSYNWIAPAATTTITHPNGPGPNDTVVIVNFSAAFTSSAIGVQAVNDCGVSSTRTRSITLQVSTPGAITATGFGLGCPDRFYIYSIPSFPLNATSIAWSAPAGGTIVFGQGTTTIHVSYAAAMIRGNVSVVGINNCHVSSPRRLPVSFPPCRMIAGVNMNEPSIARNGIRETMSNEMEVKIFPNPALTGFNLQINSNNKEDITIRIMDVTGRFIRERKTTPYSSMYFGAELKAGIYIVEIRQGKSVKTERVIKL